MRISAALIATALLLPLGVACGDHHDEDAEPFDTLQACYDDHHGEEGLSVQQAIVVCCLDHPIAGVHPSCTSTQAECITHVRAALDTSVLDAEISAACTTYISEK